MLRTLKHSSLLILGVFLLSACSTAQPTRLAAKQQSQMDPHIRYAHLYADLNTGQYNKAMFNWMAK